jgi:DNA-binding LytR/AlgR family response regulator
MKWKVAILEDDQYQLKDLKETLSSLKEVEVVAWSTGSIEFMSKVAESFPDVIIVDINLNGDPASGIQVAHRLKLPVIFASGNNAAYLKDIEILKRDHDLLVDHITKPIREEDLIKTVVRFLRDLSSRRSSDQIWLKLGEVKEKFDQAAIVYIGTDKNFGSESNNKVISFKDRNPGVLVDFSFVRMAEMGFDMTRFTQIHKSFIVNKDHLIAYDPVQKSIKVKACDETGNLKVVELPVSDNYSSLLRNLK